MKKTIIFLIFILLVSNVIFVYGATGEFEIKEDTEVMPDKVKDLGNKKASKGIELIIHEKNIFLTNKQLKKGAKIKISKGDKIQVNISNEFFTLNIQETTPILKIEEETLILKQTKEFDLNKDNTPDLTIKLEEISSDEDIILFITLPEKQEIEEPKKSEDKITERLKDYKEIIAIAIILIILLFLIIKKTKKHKKKHKKNKKKTKKKK